jgi:hypothetical protein
MTLSWCRGVEGVAEKPDSTTSMKYARLMPIAAHVAGPEAVAVRTVAAPLLRHMPRSFTATGAPCSDAPEHFTDSRLWDF